MSSLIANQMYLSLQARPEELGDFFSHECGPTSSALCDPKCVSKLRPNKKSDAVLMITGEKYPKIKNIYNKLKITCQILDISCIFHMITPGVPTPL